LNALLRRFDTFVHRIALVALSLLTSQAPSGKADKVEKKADKAATREVNSDPPPAPSTGGAGALDEPRKAAEKYLNALQGKNDGSAREFLLGGATLTANDFSIPNWKIIKRDGARTEERSLPEAIKAMWHVDKVGAESLNTVVVAEGDNLTLTQDQAQKILGPTRDAALAFQDRFPLFSYVARIDKDLFWHPENPWRKEVKRLGKDGNYKLEMHRFTIEEKEPGKPARLWPLRVLRVQTNSYDSGWKILPASDWDPNY
jgi:hypothetical protein